MRAIDFRRVSLNIFSNYNKRERERRWRGIESLEERGEYIYIYGTGGNNVAINYTTRRMSIPDSRDFLWFQFHRSVEFPLFTLNVDFFNSMQQSRTQRPRVSCYFSLFWWNCALFELHKRWSRQFIFREVRVRWSQYWSVKPVVILFSIIQIYIVKEARIRLSKSFSVIRRV